MTACIFYDVPETRKLIKGPDSVYLVGTKIALVKDAVNCVSESGLASSNRPICTQESRRRYVWINMLTIKPIKDVVINEYKHIRHAML